MSTRQSYSSICQLKTVSDAAANRAEVRTSVLEGCDLRAARRALVLSSDLPFAPLHGCQVRLQGCLPGRGQSMDAGDSPLRTFPLPLQLLSLHLPLICCGQMAPSLPEP